MTRKTVEEFFDNYAAAFSRGDVDEISRLWMLPAFITTADRAVCFADVNAFRKNTEALCGFYADQGLSRAKKTVLDFNPLSDAVAAITTRDELFDSSGAPITQWVHAYLVRETDAGIRTIAAVADNEMNAWEARGTPLGRRGAQKHAE